MLRRVSSFLLIPCLILAVCLNPVVAEEPSCQPDVLAAAGREIRQQYDLRRLEELEGLMKRSDRSPPLDAGPGQTWSDPKTGITLAYIPAGTFMMGSPARPPLPTLKEHRAVWGNGGTSPLHEVTLSKPFWMGTTEVTNAQYRLFVSRTGHGGGAYPV